MEQQLLSLLSKGSLTSKSWKLIFVVLIRVNPEMPLTLLRTSLPWWVHNLENKWSPVVLFVSYLYSQPPPFMKFMYLTLTSIHMMKFRIGTIFVGTHVGAIQHIYKKKRIVAPWHDREKVAFSGQLGNVSWKNIVITDMFVYVVVQFVLWNNLFLYQYTIY